MRILGIDPGLRHTGWGVIEQSGSRLSHIAHGVIRIDPQMALSARLGGIYREVMALASEFTPDCAGIEETLVNANPRSALKLGQARGAAMAALHGAGLDAHEYSPRTIKLAIVGTGGADKAQVSFMVARLLPQAGKMASDAADALACAICTAHHVTTSARGAA
ncbi:crossover junction endodeoxyribonuclease RuvC [Henriciella aquimarina]|uniref:crossover junction endodeoxyribonuclease RuvC n=1 Tax=Henriciella aquimarina TaxID=545261 RepID=UPI000A0131AB